MAQVHLSTQKGMAVIALERCYQDLRESDRRANKFPLVGQGVLGGVITCAMCVCLISAIRPHALLNLFFLCFDNLMLEFFLLRVGECLVGRWPGW